MDINSKIFDKINGLVGRNRLLDAFGRAGAEWVIFVMFVWYAASSFFDPLSSFKKAITPIVCFLILWIIGWGVDIALGMFTKEYRPHIAQPEKKFLFIPMMDWKSFPSDHAMTSFLIFFMAMIFQLPFFWGLLFLALWVVWGRVYAGLHYPIDVLGGISIAFFWAVIFDILYLLFL